MQTRERRIYLHYRALRRRHDYRRGERHSVWMKLATRWDIPIREVREIIDTQKNGA